jgi:hypothetical protein
MRERLLTLVVGLAAGMAGALIIGRRGAEPPARVSGPPRTRETPPTEIVPPGWDRRYLVRVNELEARLDQLDQRTAPPSEREQERPALDLREQDKLAHYDQELAAQRARLAEHDREDVDLAWSASSAERVRATADEIGVAPRAIDCRSKSCVATLSFTNPEAGLGFLRSAKMSKLVAGFSSMTSTPTPPTSAGDYDLTVVLDR